MSATTERSAWDRGTMPTRRMRCAAPQVVPASGPSVVSLIDRRTGAVPRLGNRALVVLTEDPAAAVRHLLDGRDAALWEARIEPFGAMAGRPP